MMRRCILDHLHTCRGEHCEGAAAIVGALLAADISALGQTVDALGQAALRMQKPMRQLGHAQSLGFRLGQMDEHLVVVHRESGRGFE